MVSRDVEWCGFWKYTIVPEGTINKEFSLRWNDRTVTGAARRALETMMPSIATSTIPVDLTAASRYVGIEQTLEVVTTEFDGLLRITRSGSYIAEVRKDLGAARKRFTLAHEIGHIIVYRSIDKGLELTRAGLLECRARTREQKDTERLCDTVATELLMPRSQFLQCMSDTGVCAATISTIARRFGVSLQAASRRILHLLPYDIGIGLWTQDAAARRFVPKWYLTKHGSMPTEYVIEEGQQGSACFTDHVIRGWHWIALHGRMDKYYVDISPLPSSAKSWLAFFVFSDAPHHTMATISARRAIETPYQHQLMSR